MLAAYYGRNEPIAVLREKAGTGQNGTSLAGLIQAARTIGFDAHGVRATVEALPQLDLPAIAHWSKNGRKHFVVLYKVTARQITVGDPAEGLLKLNPGEFIRYWSGILVLLKPEPVSP
jgi:ABC-type bacteriocin/lantibiotic exporter with double-glycine peptidase domain